MRRVTIALGVVAILASSCGESRFPAQLAATLQDKVTQIRTFAENGRPGLARSELAELVQLVSSKLDAGRIDQGRATEILEAAQVVAERLALVPRTSPSRSPSPSPVDEGDEGNGGGKGEGKGKSDEDHGNDD